LLGHCRSEILAKKSLAGQEPVSASEITRILHIQSIEFLFYCGSGTLSVRALGDPKFGDPSECQPTLERSRRKHVNAESEDSGTI